MIAKELNVEERPLIKKNASRRYRAAGKIPAVIYGSSMDNSLNILVDEREFNQKFKIISENTIIRMKGIEGDYDVLIKDYQEDILTGGLEHIDFYEVEKGKSLKTHVPIHISGTPVGVRSGGVLEQPIHEIEVECLPKDLPDSIDLEIAHLEINDSIHVSDITPPAGVTFLSSEDQVVVHVATQTKEVVSPEAAIAEGGEAAAEEASESAKE